MIEKATDVLTWHTPFDKGSRTSDCLYSNTWGEFQASVYHPLKEENGCSCIVFGHGFLGQKGMYSWIGEGLAREGYLALLFTVPRIARLEPRQWRDGFRSAIDYVLDTDELSEIVGSNRIGVMGHSLGGLGALMAASEDSRIQCVVGLAPAILPKYFTIPKDFMTPIQLQIGTEDRFVPLRNIIDFYTHSAAEAKELIRIKGGNHVQFLDKMRFFETSLVRLMDNQAFISTEEQHKISHGSFIGWFNRSLKA